MKNTIIKKTYHKKSNYLNRFYKLTNSILNLVVLFVMLEATYFISKLIGFLSTH